MVPNETTEGHDPRYWCLPPVHYEPDAVSAVGGGYEYHLVMRGREVGVWKDWTVAQAMVSGFPNSGHKRHHSYEACVAEWQRHWLLGVHPHPVASRLPSKSASTPQKEVAASSITTVSSISPISSVATGISTMSMTERGSTPHLNAHPSPRYYAISGGGQVYSTKHAAKLAFDRDVEDGGEPNLLLTEDFDVVLVFAEGDM
ncbi:hypothetical protein DFH08DRAFT_874935 [Mycena albidolilacea]|uniref:Ribonuclease H1 N-terminal domain-containing protein n=1 Tax=Mycena albidolilacea TaxID=1033008 RepID=A0AAD7EMN5_9AGAR|nr:hypothetical protein DFH08DRAFT_874935 [Mycena albidolilacea]